MKITQPKSADVSAGVEMGARRVAKPEVLSKRAKPRSPATSAASTRPVIENMRPNTLGTTKKNHVAAIRNDPALKVPPISRES